jgi:16S rRNA (guanine527-N7)-methyltransferase
VETPDQQIAQRVAQQVEDRLLAAGIRSLPPSAGRQFSEFLSLLLRWNARLNLTSIRAPEEILRRHFIECAFVAQFLPEGASTLLDFGSGAGFPGIPIAICRPELQVTLAESRGKKAAFLREAVRVLRISAEVYHGRVQDLPASKKYDIVALRAVDKMQEAIRESAFRTIGMLAVMTTLPAIPGHEALAPELAWRDPIALPESSSSVLLIGERK